MRIPRMMRFRSVIVLAALSLSLSAAPPGLPSASATSEVVAGTTSDLMIVRHLVLRGTNEQIGESLAKIAIKNHRVEPNLMDKKLLAERLAWFRSNYPEIMARAKGVQRVYSVAKTSDEDFTSLPYDYDVAPGCSVVYYPGSSVTNGHAMLSRNYDFPKATYAALTHQTPIDGARSMTGDPYVIEMYPTDGYSALYTCAYDLLRGAIDGVNERGVTVALLADDMSTSRKRGVTPHVGLGEIDLPRFILDKAASAKEARRLLKNVPYYATFTPCHYIIGDATGDSFIFEVDANNQHHVIDGKGLPQLVTNHSIAEYGTTNLPQGNSFDRYRRLQKEIADRKGRVTPAEVKEINYCVAVPEGVMKAATLWHAVYDVTDRSVKISFCLSRSDEAKQRRTPYLSFRLKR